MIKTFDKLIKTGKQRYFSAWLSGRRSHSPHFLLPPVSTEFSPEVDLLSQLLNLGLSLCQCREAAGLGSGQIFPVK